MVSANKNQNKDEELEKEDDFAGELEDGERLDLDLDNNKDAKEEAGLDDNTVISKPKIILAKKLLENIKENNERLIQLLGSFVADEDEARINIGQLGEDEFGGVEKDFSADSEQGKIIEGVFDGENMIGPDGKQYSVPANYASKSKLVEGDILKLTITGSGTFVYKQIGPIERIRKVGMLEKDNEGHFFVNDDDRKWQVLPASVTYYKGHAGDEAVILIPKTGESKWAAVENIVRNNE